MIMPRPPSSKSTRPLRALKLVGGFALLIVGGVLAIPGVPGPGIPVILLGLLLLSDQFAWARRAIVWVKVRTARFRRTGDEGACSR
jgi:Putative transmembrane protein (PGPGW)